MDKLELIQYLDWYLQISEWEDTSKNWLQVDNSKKEIKKIWYAVDATEYIIDQAIEQKIDLLIVHHWLFWGFESPITGVHYNRISKLIKNNIALYACHLPLDGHPEVGNNIGLANKFIEIMVIKGEIEQHSYSFWLRFEEWISIDQITNKYCETLWLEKNLYNFSNKEKINSILFSSGWWLFHYNKAKENNYDLLITGEWAHYEISWAKDLWQSVLLWGHYETETLWVKQLSLHLQKEYQVDVVFLDEKY